METSGGMASRITEKIVTGVVFALLVVLGVTLWRMDPATRTAIWNGIWKTAAWCVLAAALPWSGRLFIARVSEIGTNWAGAGLIGAYVLIDVVAALLFMGGLPGGGWAWTATLVGLGLAGSYNYLVTEYLAEQCGG
ncbi:hypothetical protein RAS1_21520 [Phycisphaerae bacterium RAS1]|nr:hypothetical protein RAS1_21520 [Phycisphaerae bacterium RAS1]